MNWLMNWATLLFKLMLTILSLLLLIQIFFGFYWVLKSIQYKKIKEEDNKSKNKKWYNKFIDFYKCYIHRHKSTLFYIISAVMMLGLPIAIQNNYVEIGTSFKRCINIGAPSDWLGFWGSYLGSVLTILFAYFNTEYKTNKNAREQASKLATIDKKEKTEKAEKLKATLKNALKRISFRSTFKNNFFNYKINKNSVSYLEKNSEEIYNDINKVIELETSLKDMILEIDTKTYKELSDQLLSNVTSLIENIRILYPFSHLSYLSNIDNGEYINIINEIEECLSNIKSTADNFEKRI